MTPRRRKPRKPPEPFVSGRGGTKPHPTALNRFLVERRLDALDVDRPLDEVLRDLERTPR